MEQQKAEKPIGAGNPIRALSQSWQAGVEKYFPDAFVFALVLSFIVIIMGMVLQRETPWTMVKYWGDGFWAFLAFAMQMALILVLGYALAAAPTVRRGITRLARASKSDWQSYLIGMTTSWVAGYISWGLGMIVAAFVARETCHWRKGLHYGFTVAINYTALMVGVVGGLTITAPLLVNTPGHFMTDFFEEIGITGGLIPLTQTIWSPSLVVMVVGGFACFIGIAYAMRPRRGVDEIKEISPEVLETLDKDAMVIPRPFRPSVAERLDYNRTIWGIIVALGAGYLIYFWVTRGLASVGLNAMNFFILFLGLGLHGSPIHYVRALARGAYVCAPILLQFPFYAGIQGMMIHSGLAATIAGWIVGVATPITFPFLNFVQACVINMFIPSAGGQYMVTAHFMHTAGHALGVPASTVVNSYTMGDICTNMVQPFWALPMLGVAGLGIRDIWGWCLVGFLTFFVIATIICFAIL